MYRFYLQLAAVALPIFFFAASPCVPSDAAKTPVNTISDYRKAMRSFVINIAGYARGFDKGFIVIPQNAQEVAWNADDETDEYGIPLTSPDAAYFSAINGTGREDTFFGYPKAGSVTKPEIRTYFTRLCDAYLKSGLCVLSIDYTKSKANIKKSYSENSSKSYVGFAAPNRILDIIPENSGYDPHYYPYLKNSADIKNLSDAKNFLYVIGMKSNNPDGSDLVAALAKTDYDLIIMDVFVNGTEIPFKKDQIESLKKKACGGTRLVIAYMSIGEAEDYRWYWNPSWTKKSKIMPSAPEWLCGENPDWSGNYKVRYWDEEWQKIIFRTDNSYTKKIIDAGFDGVYLDIIDAYEYFEGKAD
ncbi:endo alpha-1,4 polygalactosaminidase [Treponema parvum]|uniref:Endo alpha-1,4 polygalactosaminidase n=1 Tax=Treponema parvum TaxID=138851 RepID=A0A975F108_9SPIR|nr:endo alpha-1,4 polygalactosaminidase [Treponema parvum]QTQ12382.1 endo alpha-1,4 polygalactosaminidase [Treponema parvum]QTQ15625.1 endo alpha-1,4 polygalactosaminidase [Treponema parvum]